MPNPDQLRDLIERVDEANGPIVAMFDDTAPSVGWGGGSGVVSADALADPEVQDLLAGVLRRDMIHRGLYDVTHVHNDEDRHTVVWSFNQADGESQADDVLTAFLNAWLEAARKLRWRPSGEAA